MPCATDSRLRTKESTAILLKLWTSQNMPTGYLRQVTTDCQRVASPPGPGYGFEIQQNRSDLNSTGSIPISWIIALRFSRKHANRTFFVFFSLNCFFPENGPPPNLSVSCRSDAGFCFFFLPLTTFFTIRLGLADVRLRLRLGLD